MRLFKHLLTTLTLLLVLAGGLAAQGVTTSSMSGVIFDTQGNEPLIGANVVAVHEESGTLYGTSTDLDGNYRISGMRVGGPYRVTVSYTGYSEQVYQGIYLRLGENRKLDVLLDESAVALGEVVVSAQAGITGQSSGTSTQITSENIDVMPTLNRDVRDYLRLTPQASNFGDGISFAGINNRYNAIYIDGAVNNDVFGLAGSGTNGGQTGSAPFSIDIIDQLQVVLSPYDVTLGGFAGAGVNAVTKSGTNQFRGTAYYFLQNENMVGKTNKRLADMLGIERTEVAPFDQRIYGASLGGPIVKDKVFFFANVEIQDDETPVPFELGIYRGDSGSRLGELRNFVQNQYGYDPGDFGSTSDQLQGLKLFGKLDFNLGDNNKLTLRHQYNKAENFDRNAGGATFINFSNNGVYFPSITNSSALELNSRFGNKYSNNLIVGFTTVRDDRDALGGDFPYVFINDGSGQIAFGSEQFSTANELNQNILTLTDNFKIYSGNHTFTLGTHNEFYDIYNVFIPQNYGVYRFDSVDDFISGANAIEYDRSYSLVDELTGDGTAAAAEFTAMQFGLYAQDEWSVNRKFTLTYGLRLDLPIIPSDPASPSNFASTLQTVSNAYEVARDVEVGQAPSGQLMFSPRVGFEYDAKADRSSVLRGGIGIFTSRIPFVWPGAMFNNNGLSVGNVSERNITGDITFQPDINRQYINPNFTVPSGQVDLFTKNFKYPQVFRTNLALDQTLPGDIVATVEGLYTKTLNNIVYTNVNSDPEVDFNWSGTPDTRPVFSRTDLDPTYNAIYVASNTDQGYTYALTGSLSKRFQNGLLAMIAYTYTDGEAVNEGTSSQNSSQWRGQVSIDGRNSPVLGRSDYVVPHRIVSSLSYGLDWGRDDDAFQTQVSLFYNGQSGDVFSYVIGGGSGRNLNNETGSTSRNRSLIYIPASQSDINLVDYTSGGQTITAAQQWANLDAFIEGDDYLSANRGGYAAKNGAIAPFTGIFDFGLRQNIGAVLGNRAQKLQLSFDILNLANLLNPEWGVRYNIPGDFNNYFLYQFEGYTNDANGERTVPTFTYRGGDTVGQEAFNISNGGSRWRARLGLRYIF